MVKCLTRYMMTQDVDDDDNDCSQLVMMMMMMVMPTHQVHDQGEECERRRQKRVRIKELDSKVEPCVPHKRFNQTPRKNKSKLK